MSESFYFDTYALVEITKGNQAFIDYTEKEIVINDLTLAEFYHVLLRDYNVQTADYWFKKISSNSKPAPKELLIEAVRFRRLNRQKNKNFSFFDAVGYVYAVKNGFKFLTGDGAFEGLPGVEFVR